MLYNYPSASTFMYYLSCEYIEAPISTKFQLNFECFISGHIYITVQIKLSQSKCNMYISWTQGKACEIGVL